MRGVKAANFAFAFTLVSGAIQLRLSIRRPMARDNVGDQLVHRRLGFGRKPLGDIEFRDVVIEDVGREIDRPLPPRLVLGVPLSLVP